jgi:hypothetical protein
MPQKKKSNGRRANKSRGGASVGGMLAGDPAPRGDEPRMPRSVYETISCRIPKTTATYTCRQLQETTIVASASAVTTLNLIFNLNVLDNVTPFTALFDQWRIDAVKLRIVPQQPGLAFFTNTTTTFTPLFCVIDYDDNTALSSAANARAYNTAIELGCDETCTRVFRPRAQMQVNNASGTTGGIVSVAPDWVDCSTASVNHYGVKFFISQATAAQTTLASWNIFWDVYISFRGVR